MYLDLEQPLHTDMKNGVLSRMISVRSAKRPNKNKGEEVTQSQQRRILLSASLMSFTILGKGGIKMRFARTI